ncbi:hypothetical protein FRB94_001461 [Tulasnella sp. JGI-2019a]|nr:hypothetical protein FRB93_003657 [Tulasnella sp. JGI-2019a]KAG9005534.1 hypothetical protein FRB94_001461 [Tulasnella sp. JGI-2019a]KAG9032504.1 hypothetical protein FRB95_001411 [Tulasnella sp. JGI-2019a]
MLNDYDDNAMIIDSNNNAVHFTATDKADPPIGQLPTELVLQIINRLRTKDLKRFVLTCKYFRRIGGPLVYGTQRIPDVEHLVRLSLLASQPEVAEMIEYLDIDAVAMEYWWLGLSHVLEELLPKLTRLSSLRIHLSRVLSSNICLALSRITTLETLRIKLDDVSLGPHVRLISNLKHIEIDFAPPSATHHPQLDRGIENIIAFLSSSHSTLETLTMHEHAMTQTAGFVKYMEPHAPFDELLHSCPNLTSLSINMEVGNDGASALAAVDAIAGRPVTSLKLKCRPAIWPVPPSNGYSMGLDVVKRISEKCPELRELVLEDGDVGKTNLNRAADGMIVEEHMAALRQLPNLRNVELPLLMDDLLLYQPKPDEAEVEAAPKSDSDPTGTTTPNRFTASGSDLDLLARPRLEFQANVDSIMKRTVKSTLLTPESPTTTTSTPTSPTKSSSSSSSISSYDDTSAFPLRHLESLTFHLHPTPQLGRDLRGMRIFVPGMVWKKRIVWDEHNPKKVIRMVSEC